MVSKLLVEGAQFSIWITSGTTLMISFHWISSSGLTLIDCMLGWKVNFPNLLFPKGLSHREHLLENEGMLFNFNDPGDRTFHMRDCLIPLDILFIKNGKVNKIYHECQPCEIDECDKYVGEADSVVELLGGTCKKNNISEGLIYRHF